jgi:hypothetical protein
MFPLVSNEMEDDSTPSPHFEESSFLEEDSAPCVCLEESSICVNQEMAGFDHEVSPVQRHVNSNVEEVSEEGYRPLLVRPGKSEDSVSELPYHDI